MKTEKLITLVLFFVAAAMLVLQISAAAEIYTSPFSYYGANAGYYFPNTAFSNESCENGQGQDFIIEIPPGACQPAVVRSDLLEEQDVPVFCRITGIKINPLIDTPNIKNVVIPQASLEKGISGVTFHPYRAALKSSYSQLVGSPLSNELGYIVVILKQNPTEKTMPDSVNANLTARIDYTVTSSFGIGLNEILLPEMDDSSWNQRYPEFSFWLGKGFARAKNIKDNSATIELYTSSDRPFTSFDISTGDLNEKLVYFPGSYCSVGAKIKLNEIIYPQTKAELLIDGNKVQAIKGMKIMDECTVMSITPSVYGLGGRVDIKCPDKTYTLEKVASRAKLSVGGRTEWFAPGSIIDSSTNSSLVFAGKVILKAASGSLNSVNIVIVGKNVKADDIYKANERINKLLISELDTLNAGNIDSKIKGVLGANMEYTRDASATFSSGLNLRVEEIEGLSDIPYSGIVKTYYDKAITSYEDVAKNYPSIKKSDGTTFGERALWEAAEKAERFNQGFESLRLWKEFVSVYPDSKFANSAKEKASVLMTSAINSQIISVRGKSHTVSLQSILEPSVNDAGVEALVNGAFTTLSSRQIIGDDWQLDSITQNYAVAKYIGTKENTDRTRNLEIGKETILGNTTVKITKINFNRQARITISPYNKEGTTYANFSVHIGIEKRAVQLSTDQTKSLISDLDKTITQWTELRDKLGKIVGNWKKACFAGSAALWAKNFLSGLSGSATAMARQNVMRDFPVTAKDGTIYKGYVEFCSNKKNWDEFGAVSVTDCIFRNNDKIKTAINFNKDIIDDVNSIISKCSSSKISRGGILKGSIINETAMSDCLRENVGRYSDISVSRNVTVSPTQKQFITLSSSDILNNQNFTKLQEMGFGKADSRDLLFLLEAKSKCEGSGINCTGIEDRLYDKFSSAQDTIKIKTENDAAQSVFGDSFSYVGTYIVKGEEVPSAVSRVDATKGELKAALKAANIADSEIVSPMNIPGVGNFIFTVEQIGGRSSYAVNKIYQYNNGKISVFDTNNKTNNPATVAAVTKIKTISALKSCNNPGADIQLQYWDSGSFKGFPAIMPLGTAPDGSQGWYFAVKGYPDTIQAGVTSMQPYTEAGSPTHFYICNVGPNKLVNFADEPSADEECCQYFALTETYSGQTNLPGMTKEQTAVMVNRAVSCMKKATTSYGSTKTVSLGECGNAAVGSPKALVPNTQCEDFMSPTDCRIMYNLCDPVICPSSRCNLGGRFTVSDVVQTGIFGSLFLCLPNAREGVIMPVCLSGLHAGLDGYVSILQSAQGCLKESLATGKNIGICDQLTSVYMCEFFWRQAAPFIKVGVPNLVESALGRRSGGEYLTFQASWDNSIKSVQYFTDYYGVNALNAFKIRSTEEAGSFLCKGFVGLRYPDSASLFEELAKPESPVQINAWFDDIPFSSVTIPATSQYKVFWHIYAGNDQAAYYQIYLKTPPTVSEANLPQMYTIATGYIEKGETAEVSKDLTAPSGYKELCVRINLKEYCGFKKVSTGFLTNYLTDVYLGEQTTPSYAITSQEDCTSGTASSVSSSALSLIVQPSAGGLEETINPQIYKRGIIRICSQENPGKGSDELRWSRVGFCNKERTVSCWADRDSVEAAITDLKITEDTLKDLDAASKTISDLIGSDFGYMDSDESKYRLQIMKEDVLPEIYKDIALLKEGATDAEIKSAIQPSIDALNKILSESTSEESKAEAQILIGEIYNKVADRMKTFVPAIVPLTSGSGGIETLSDKCDFLNNITGCLNNIEDKKGIPENLILGVAIHESAWGTVPVGNNYFGIKPGASWNGATLDHRTIEYENGKYVGQTATFRNYASMCASVQDFITVVSSQYASDINSNPETMAKNMIDGSGRKYATDPNWANAVITRIGQIPEVRTAISTNSCRGTDIKIQQTQETATGIILGPAYVGFENGKSDLTDDQKNKLTKDLLAIPKLAGYTLVVTGYYAQGEDESIALKRAENTYTFVNSQFGTNLKNNKMGLSFESGGLGDKQVKIRGVVCSINRAAWSATTARAGDTVDLRAYGDKTNCEGIMVYFSVKESDLLSETNAAHNPTYAVFSNGVATTTWTAEWLDDGLMQGDPEYVFYANIPLMPQIKSGNELSISRQVLLIPNVYVFTSPFNNLSLSSVASWYGKREDEIAQLNNLPKIGAKLSLNQKIDISLTTAEFNNLKEHKDLLKEKYPI